jgi:hypothetical protein
MDRLRNAVLQLGNDHRLAEKQAKVEQARLHHAALSMPKRFFPAVFDRLVGIIIESINPVRQFGRRGLIRLACQALGLAAEPCRVKPLLRRRGQGMEQPCRCESHDGIQASATCGHMVSPQLSRLVATATGNRGF